MITINKIKADDIETIMAKYAVVLEKILSIMMHRDPKELRREMLDKMCDDGIIITDENDEKTKE